MKNNYKPESPADRFYKRLGGLTAILPGRSGICRHASLLLAYEANRRSQQYRLERDIVAKQKFEEWFKKRPSAKWSWWEKITAREKDYDL